MSNMLSVEGRILIFYYFLSDFVYPSSKFAIPLSFAST